MTSILPVSPSQPAPTPASTPAPTQAETGFESTDFETFLQMLTAQIQNQDPLNPMQSSDFAVQLATFSGVEQQVLTNDLLRSMAGDATGRALDTHAAWVGMEARLTGSVVVDGTEKSLAFEPVPGARKLDLVVQTPNGDELHRHDVTGQDPPFAWSGTAPSGHPLLDGPYRVELHAQSASGAVTVHPVHVYERISEVRAGDDGPQVVLADGRELGVADVTGLRAPVT